MPSIQSVVRVGFITLGCAKNEADSHDMATLLSSAGYCVVDSDSECDAIIINTCSFIQAATEESIDTIFEVADRSRVETGECKLIVAGCMPSRYGSELSEELEEVDLLIPCDREHGIVAQLDALFPNRDHAEASPTPTPGASAYLKISDGCDRNCTYCTIPSIRGAYRSFPLEDILADARTFVDAGVKELVLIAQDTGRWGHDFEQKSSLPALLEALVDAFPTTWIRVMYLQPSGLTDELLNVMAAHDTICNYFDMPLQHADRDVLRQMNRAGDGDEYLSSIEKIRRIMPDATVRTTLISGFPGETYDQHLRLIDFIEEAEFDYLGVFPYSREDGTVAADLPDQLEEEDKIERAQEVRDVADAISTARIAERVGATVDVLVLGYEEDGQRFGRTKAQAPDVDGIVYVDRGEPGDIITVEIEDTLMYEMEGRYVGTAE